MKTAFISHPDTLLHVMDGSHPESPARINVIKNALISKGIYQKLDIYEAPLATDRELQRVHSSAYIQKIRALSPKAGLVRLDPDTAMGPMSLSAAAHASGAVIFATDLIMRNMADNAFCCIRPPGHHAGRANSAGFCIFNHVAIGVAHAFEKYGIQRAAIIDFDVHHGDGTEDIFRNDPRVMLCSTFQHPFYPHRGAETRSDRMLNIPLPAKAGRKEFQLAFEQEFLPALNVFKPEIIYISAGFDAHTDDPLADMRLTDADYAWMTQFTLSIARQHAQGRVISSLEGGYNLGTLGDAVGSHVQTLLG